MNFALPAVVIFLIALPGFAFRSRFKLSEGKRVDYSPFGQVVTESLIWSALLHAIVLGGSYLLFGKVVQLDLLIRLLSNGATAADQATLARDIWWVVAYFASIFTLAVGLSAMLRHLVSKCRWDRGESKLSWLFRFRQAPWYYLLSGADFSKGEKPDLIQVAALVDVAGSPYLYQGVLEHYFVNEQGNLDRIVLSEASRRPLRDDAPELTRNPKNFAKSSRSEDAARFRHKRTHREAPPRFYPILGHYFVIHYDELVTLNVRYIKLEPEDLSEPDEVAT